MTRRVLFLGFTLPDEVVAEIARKSPMLPTQTHNFAWNVVKSLRASGVEVRLLSTHPVPDYPKYPKLVFRTERFSAHGVGGMTIGFVNALVLKHLSRTVQLLIKGDRYVDEQKVDVILVHGVHTPFLRYAARRRRSGSRAVAVLTDPPGVVLSTDGMLRRLLKGLDRRSVTKLLRSFDAVIALTPGLADALAPGVPCLTTPGFIPELDRTAVERGGGPVVIAYAGGLSAGYGVDRLVHAVTQIQDERLVLDLYGRGDLEPWLREQATKNKRVRLRGALPPDQAREAIGKADILVNPRTLTDEHILYSFPSKLLEYIALGVPTITTPLPAIPDALRSALVITKDDSVAALVESIQDVAGWEDQARSVFGENARQVGRRLLSPESQGAKISAFLFG